MIARPKSPWALRSVATSGQCDAAHDGALRLSPASGRCPQPAGHQLTGQLAMMLVMVGYTFTGLYLLFGG